MALLSRAAMRIDIIIAPREIAMINTAIRFLERSTNAQRSATAEILHGALQLCTSAPAQTAAPNARARLSITRAASL